VAEEPVYLNEYNETLIRKLETKLTELEEANRALEQAMTERQRAEEERQRLCSNAEYAMRAAGGVLEVRLTAVEVTADFAALHPPLQPGPHVRLTVQDTGHGMTPAILARIFEPFFTTKRVGEGTGLGLAVVYGIITDHGGAIVVQSTPGHGTTVDLYLPRIDRTAADSHPAATLHQGTERILFVDDEVTLAHVGQMMLERLGYHVVTCTNSVEALAAFRTAPQDFDLVITD
jgi:CheY-like chemotaxis protein